MGVIPLFKSHFSIGRSILTLNESACDPEGADSLILIAKEHGLKDLFLVEDCMTSFMKADKLCNKFGINLRFGFRFDCYSNKDLIKETSHKIVVFAKDSIGVKALYRIHKAVFSGNYGILDSELNGICDEHVYVVVPFYDSYIAKNTLAMGKCIPNFPKASDLFYFIEDNKLPFDGILKKSIEVAAPIARIVPAKSIFYKNRADYSALQTYKLICNRKFGKQATLNNPNLEHFASREFCWESYLEQIK